MGTAYSTQPNPCQNLFSWIYFKFSFCLGDNTAISQSETMIQTAADTTRSLYKWLSLNFIQND